MSDIDQCTLSAKVRLQVDLEGHSAWVAVARSQPQVVQARVDLAKQLHYALRKAQFTLLSWKGDGGVYYAPQELAGNLDFAVSAASKAAAEFDKWRAQSPDRSSLRFRISVHLAPDVYVHKDRKST